MKKIFCTLLMLLCMFSLTACNGEKKTLSYNEDAVKGQVESLYNLISTTLTADDVSELKEANIYELDALSEYLFNVYTARIEGETFVNAVESYYGSTPEMGDVSAKEEFAFDAKEDELIVTYKLSGSSHDGSLEVIYDKNLTITSITTNVEYSFEELMAKAGTNTAIGMGTVFAMLIIIMFIIMILGLVPKLFEKKPKEDIKKDGVDKAIEGIVARETAEEEDDTELVAVIAAAIAAYEGTSTDGFVVRSIKRIK